MQILIKTDKSNWCHLFLSGRKNWLRKIYSALVEVGWNTITEICEHRMNVQFCCFLRQDQPSMSWVSRAVARGAGQQSQLLSKLAWCSLLWPDVIPDVISAGCSCEHWGWHSSALSLQSALQIAGMSCSAWAWQFVWCRRVAHARVLEQPRSAAVWQGIGQVLPTENWLLSQMTAAWEPSLCSREFGWLIITSSPPSLGGRRCYRHLIIMKTSEVFLFRSGFLPTESTASFPVHPGDVLMVFCCWIAQ